MGEQELSSEALKTTPEVPKVAEGFRNTRNPWEAREKGKAKILELLSQDLEKEWSATELSEEAEINYQSCQIILLELALEGRVIIRVPANYRKVYRLNTDKVVKEWVEREAGKPIY